MLSLKRGFTKKQVIWLVLFTTIILSFGQIFLKYASNFQGPIYLNYFALIGIFLFGLSGLLMLVCLKFGELSLVYPFLATSYVWVALFSMFFFKETVSTMAWIGIFTILVGITLVGVGGKK